MPKQKSSADRCGVSPLLDWRWTTAEEQSDKCLQTWADFFYISAPSATVGYLVSAHAFVSVCTPQIPLTRAQPKSTCPIKSEGHRTFSFRVYLAQKVTKDRSALADKHLFE